MQTIWILVPEYDRMDLHHHLTFSVNRTSYRDRFLARIQPHANIALSAQQRLLSSRCFTELLRQWGIRPVTPIYFDHYHSRNIELPQPSPLHSHWDVWTAKGIVTQLRQKSKQNNSSPNYPSDALTEQFSNNFMLVNLFCKQLGINLIQISSCFTVPFKMSFNQIIILRTY